MCSDCVFTSIIGKVEGGLVHTKRIEQPLLLELKQRLSRHDLDDAAQNIGRMAIIPHRSGLLGERKFRDPLGEQRIVEVALEQA